MYAAPQRFHSLLIVASFRQNHLFQIGQMLQQQNIFLFHTVQKQFLHIPGITAAAESHTVADLHLRTALTQLFQNLIVPAAFCIDGLQLPGIVQLVQVLFSQSSHCDFGHIIGQDTVLEWNVPPNLTVRHLRT